MRVCIQICYLQATSKASSNQAGVSLLSVWSIVDCGTVLDDWPPAADNWFSPGMQVELRSESSVAADLGTKCTLGVFSFAGFGGGSMEELSDAKLSSTGSIVQGGWTISSGGVSSGVDWLGWTGRADADKQDGLTELRDM